MWCNARLGGLRVVEGRSVLGGGAGRVVEGREGVCWVEGHPCR